MKKIAQLVPSKNTQEAEAIQVVVMSTPIVEDHDKLHAYNYHNEVDKDHVDNLSKNGEINSSIGGAEVVKWSRTWCVWNILLKCSGRNEVAESIFFLIVQFNLIC